MIRQLFAYVLLMAVALQTFNRGVIVSGYYLKAYVKNCENKAKPQMHCNGRCQMMKKLKNEESHDQQVVAGIKFSDIISSKSFFAVVAVAQNPLLQHHSRASVFVAEDHTKTLFHPPGMKA
jgi:hypothetical protein